MSEQQGDAADDEQHSHQRHAEIEVVLRVEGECTSIGNARPILLDQDVGVAEVGGDRADGVGEPIEFGLQSAGVVGEVGEACRGCFELAREFPERVGQPPERRAETVLGVVARHDRQARHRVEHTVDLAADAFQCAHRLTGVGQ